MSKIWRFNHIEYKHTLHRGKDCMKEFCKFLKKHAKSILDFEKKKNVAFDSKRIKILYRSK